MTKINPHSISLENKNCYQENKIIIASSRKNIILLLQKAFDQTQNFKITDIAQSSQELLHKAIVLKPDIVIADLEIDKIYPAINTIINFKSFKCKIIIVSDENSKAFKKALKYLPHSYIITNDSMSEIINVANLLSKNIVQEDSELLEEILIPEIEIVEARREIAEPDSTNKKNIFKSLSPSNWKKILQNKFIQP